EFYLTAGDHTLTFEVALGDFAPIIERINGVLDEVNGIYRNILMITGPSPDQYRDYEFNSIIPDSIANMKKQAEILQAEADKLVEITGEKGSDTAVLDKLIFQLESMNEDPNLIANMLIDFQASCSSLGDWVLNAKTQALEFDWIRLVPADQKYQSNNSFWDQICYSVLNFISSFVVDYNTMGLMSDSADNKIVNVWAVTGRDQAQIIQRLADSGLSEQGITAKVKLVSAGTLLPSVLSGDGPDVSLFNACSDPINYAVRKANVELSQMDGFDEVLQNFVPESLRAYQFEGGTYALPETTYFPMMFYRKDIFEQMGLTVPKTWDEFYALIPELQKNNMQIGFPATLTGLQIFLYQSGISLYNEELTKSNISNDGLMDKFTQLMDLYTVYTFPVAYDPANRFRTGEIPLLIADYTLYNQLTVFAPEIRGQWAFTCLPGTKNEDGTLNNAAPITTVSSAPVSGAAVSTASTGVMMLKDAKDRAAAWEFMKWWVSEETQTDFCREMETILGPSGKHPTANYKALANLSWTAAEYKALSSQFQNLVGTPEVPGGYYIARYYDFAFNETYNEGTPAYRALIRYDKTINDEITRKRQEFGLAK
ncbi:MAG: extracellular solute-binding protein, partial [Oscillospiraceae bacterium]|nr:extracellular solute-binding protein [Oscillospiraceae bacterium]